MRGLFVAIEGSDGSGKSTQIGRLSEAFENRGVTTRVVREPGGTPLGERLRELLLDRAEIEMEVEAQALLFLASRIQLYDTVIAPALEMGELVISDRYHLSTIVYQGIAPDLGPVHEARIRAVCQTVLQDRRPDLNLVIECSLDTIQSRGVLGEDRFERDRDFLARVVSAFSKLQGLAGDRIERVDGSVGIDEVSPRVVRAVEQVWEERVLKDGGAA